MRPRRAPAVIVRNSSVRLPGVRPRWRMSSLNDVIVMPFATFGSATNVPAPRRRVRRPSRTSSSSAARTVSRETPSSMPSSRSDGIASPTSSDSISSSTWSRISRCFVIAAPSATARRPAAARPRGTAARRSRGSKKWSRCGIDGELDAAADPRSGARVDAGGEQRAGAGDQPARVVARLQHLGGDRPRVDGEEDVRVGAEILEHLDDDLDRRQARRERARPRSPPAGCRGSPARRRRPRPGASGMLKSAKRTTPPSTVASTRFIAGEPMKPATKRSRGSA